MLKYGRGVKRNEQKKKRRSDVTMPRRDKKRQCGEAILAGQRMGGHM
jgi:hypothetical protein